MAIGDKLASPGGQNSPQLGTSVAAAEPAVVPKLDRGALRCSCGLPWATLQNDRIVVQSKHRGKLHNNSISVWDLLLMVLAAHRGE